MVIVAAERRLLGIVRNRAEQEFEKMYRRYAEEVFRYALLVLRSRPDAEDVTQATFVRAYRALQKGERVRKPHNWLIKIAHNECRRHLKSTSRRGIEVELDPALVPAPETDDAPSVDEIREAMSSLSFNQRAALVMRELEDRSYAEIADVLDVSVSAVETLLFRARRALREQLEGSVACDEVEELLSRQLDGALPADEQRRLRAHTRACADCATLERRQRGRRAALRRLGGMITLPSSLSSFIGGGGGTVAGGAALGLGVKAAAVVVAALTVAGVGSSEPKRAAPPVRTVEPAALVTSATPKRVRTSPAARSARLFSIATAQAVAKRDARAKPTARNHTVEPEEPTSAPPAASPAPTPGSAPAASPAPAERPTPADTVTKVVAQALPVAKPRVKVPPVALPAPKLPALPIAPGIVVPPVTITVPLPPEPPPLVP